MTEHASTTAKKCTECKQLTAQALSWTAKSWCII